MPETAAKPDLVRAIGRWSLVALMLNSIIGSGIFGQPAIVASLVGAASPLAFLVAAAGMGVIMACFAEVASYFSEAGGPYLYARVALGRFLGIEIGWLTWLVRLTASAAAANLFVNYLAQSWPQATETLPRLAVLSLLIGMIAAVNYRGVAGGAKLSNVFTVAKLLPLLLFAGAGLFFIRVANFKMPTPPCAGRWLDAVLVSIYAFGGFEAALMPMGEARNPRRDAPFALLSALGSTAILYALIQVVVVGVLPDAAHTDRPLALAAGRFLGAPGAALMSLGAMISVYGYLGSMTLNVPRLTFALARRGDFPAFFGAVHSRFRTPNLSIVVFALLVWGLAAAGSFRWNLILSSVARLFTYASTCAALMVLRKQRGREAGFRLPAGSWFAVGGIAFSAALLSRMGPGELLALGLTMAIASLNWLWARRH